MERLVLPQDIRDLTWRTGPADTTGGTNPQRTPVVGGKERGSALLMRSSGVHILRNSGETDLIPGGIQGSNDTVTPLISRQIRLSEAAFRHAGVSGATARGL